MFLLDFPRDLFMTGAIFALATIVWAGWAQEDPPSTRGRVFLGALSVAALPLLVLGIWNSIKLWGDGSAISTDKPSWTWYLVIVAIEIVVAVALALVSRAKGRTDLIAPLILLLVGVHFFPFGPLFGQPFMYVTAALVTLAALVALKMPREKCAISFWCGALAAPVFLLSSALFIWQGFAAL